MSRTVPVFANTWVCSPTFSLSCCCCSIQHKGGCSCCNRGHRKCDKQLIFIVRVRHFTFYFRSCHTLTHEIHDKSKNCTTNPRQIHNKSTKNRNVVQQIHDKSTTNRISGVWALVDWKKSLVLISSVSVRTSITISHCKIIILLSEDFTPNWFTWHWIQFSTLQYLESIADHIMQLHLPGLPLSCC